MSDAPKLETSAEHSDRAADGARSTSKETESDLPADIAAPARRALLGAGYVRLEQLTRISEAEVLALHGMGPKALARLRRALAARDQSFAAAPSVTPPQG